jgi:hypothetical protein
MPFVMDFDARNSILRVTLQGRVTDAVILDTYAAVARYVASHPPCRGITDISEVEEFEVSSNTIRQLAEKPPAFPTADMRILVAPKAHVYGMARMFQILGGKTRPNLHIVRTMDEAYSLLQVESPEFIPVSTS